MITCKHCKTQFQSTDGLLSKGPGNIAGSKRVYCAKCKKTFTVYEHELSHSKTQINDIDYPVFPDDDIPVRDLVDHLAKRFEKRNENYQAKKWFPVKINTDQPVGIAFVGDPHVDNNGCNWTLLKKHCEIMANTEGIYAVGMGDYTDNWVGRLQRLYARNDTSRDTAIKLTEWLISDSGVKWLVLIRGNHDMWSMGKDDPIYWMRNGGAPVQDWQAQFKVVFSNGREVRIDAKHDHKGFSMWNTLHGMQRAAHMKAEAEIYAGGHTHNWALHQEESASRDFTYWLIRSRGYKFMDDYAMLTGHDDQKSGATVLAVVDPYAAGSGYIQCFADLEKGAKYLQYMRNNLK